MIVRTTVQHVVLRDNYLNDDVKRELNKSFDLSVDQQLLDQNFMADPLHPRQI